MAFTQEHDSHLRYVLLSTSNVGSIVVFKQSRNMLFILWIMLFQAFDAESKCRIFDLIIHNFPFCGVALRETNPIQSASLNRSHKRKSLETG